MVTTTQILESLREAGLTQSEIARELNIPQPRISRWCNGDVPGTADDALRLLDLLSKTRAKKSKSATA